MSWVPAERGCDLSGSRVICHRMGFMTQDLFAQQRAVLNLLLRGDR